MGIFDFVGDAFSAVLDPLTGRSAALEANDKAVNAQREAAGASNQTIRDMYQTGRMDQLPFITPSLSALPMYQSAILGGPVQYQDPRYQRLSPFDADYGIANQQSSRSRAEEILKQIQGGSLTPGEDYYKDTGHGEDALGRIMRDPSLMGRGVDGQSVQLYRAPDGSYTDKPPMLTAEYKFQESPGYKWQMEQGNKQLDRSLRALGRSNSTYGMNQRNNFINNLNATEYENGINRLANLAGFGKGTAAGVGQSGNSAAGQIAGVNSNMANSLGSLYGQRGSIYTEYSPLNTALNIGKVAAAAGGFGG